MCTIDLQTHWHWYHCMGKERILILYLSIDISPLDFMTYVIHKIALENIANEYKMTFVRCYILRNETSVRNEN